MKKADVAARAQVTDLKPVRCPYLEESDAYYCRADHIRTVFTASDLGSFAPCRSGRYRHCAIYQDWIYWKSLETVERPPILVVEDEAIMRESLRDWLIDDGFQVVTAEDGEEALEVIGRQEFSIAVLDLRLPGKDGIEVLKEAKRERPDLKAIIITAYPSTETAAEAMKVGAIEYVTKPFSPDTIERLIRGALKG